MSNIAKILVRCPNWLGDIVMSLPLIEALKKHFPDATIDVLVKKPFHELFNADPRIGFVIPFEKPRSLYERLSVFKLARVIKKNRYDLSFCLTRSVWSALPLFLAKIPKRIGASRFLGFCLLTDQIHLDKTKHQRRQYLEFLKPLHLSSDEEFASLYKHGPLDHVFEKPYILMHPGASYGSAKTWPLEHYETLAALFLKLGTYKIVFLGDALQNKPKLSHPDLIDLTGKTSLGQLSSLIANAQLIICNDSGPMHMADGLGTKLLAIFGPTDPVLTGPKNKSSHILFNKTPCGPCFQRVCPIDHRCMKDQLPEMIFTKALTLLEDHGTP